MILLYFGFLRLSTYFCTDLQVFFVFVEGAQFMYEIFKQLLEQKGVTAYRVSVETGVSQGSLSDWKNGKSRPKYESIKKIADYFGVSVDYLLNGSDNKKSPAKVAEDDDFSFALLHGTEGLTEEGKKELLAYKDYLFHKYIEKNK
jgi:transcriptional regulator with XRE-family HTH domain